MIDCDDPLHPAAAEGIRLFNLGEYFEAHEALEEAWRAEAGPVRDLYRGILQIAVTYLHVTRGNYAGALKVYSRSQRWLRAWPDICRGVEIGQLKLDAAQALAEVQRLGPARLALFDRSLLKSIRLATSQPSSAGDGESTRKPTFICDRCGSEMRERNCKVICPNCGNRFDCSDLSIYFD